MKLMNNWQQLTAAIHRRTFLARSGVGLGAVALGSLLNRQAVAESSDKHWPGVVQPPHVPPRAKRVIWLTLAGGPSHLETFDHKPKLAAMDGQPTPESMTKGQQIA